MKKAYDWSFALPMSVFYYAAAWFCLIYGFMFMEPGVYRAATMAIALNLQVAAVVMARLERIDAKLDDYKRKEYHHLVRRGIKADI
jgi:hypothetical protein